MTLTPVQVDPGLSCTELLDTLFTREEQHPCLLFKSSKSEKPGLDPIRVKILLSKLLLYLMCVNHCPKASLQLKIPLSPHLPAAACLDKKYGSKEWDMKTLKEKINQKCRDALKKEKAT